MMAEFRDGTTLPQVGDNIEVAGTPVTDLYRAHLTRAFWRKAAPAKPFAPENTLSVPLTKLFVNNERFILNPRYYGRPITVKGRVREFVTDESGGRRLLLEDGGLTVQIDCSDAPEAIGNVEVGSLVSAAGICVIDSEFWSPAVPFPRNKNLFIVARGNADLQILERPPWWTPARLLIAIGTLAVFAVAVLIWNILLKKVSDRKGRDLAAARFANSVSELKVRERTRLATELHDSVVQNLTGAIMKLRAADKMFESNPAASRKQLSLAVKTLDSCRDETRNCIWDLRNQALDEPVMDRVLVRTLAPHAGDAKLTVRFAVPRDRLTDNTAHAIICIIRELVINAVRHGKAKAIQVAGCIDGESLLFSVKDDGCGFDPATCLGPDDGHFGLQGVQERLEAIGGEITIVSAPGAGTAISASIAMAKEDRQ
jgi:signal transduction histidine kinase